MWLECVVPIRNGSEHFPGIAERPRLHSCFLNGGPGALRHGEREVFVTEVILPARFELYTPRMRVLAITVIIFAAMFAIVHGAQHVFAPKPTAPLPAVNVP
jgi:hypothetical protein